MRMEGVEHALNEAIHPEEKSISPLDNIPEQPLSNYYNSCLHELKRSKKQLQEIIRLSTEAIQENKKMKRGGDISRIDKQLKEIEKKFTQKYSHHYQVIKQLSTSESLKNLKATGKDPSTWTMADIADSSIAYHQTIKQLTQKMVEMVNGAVDKIGLRKEELNPHPKQPLKFFNLWREEEQERRAIFWQQNNADHISQLNENERTTLDQLLEQFHSDYERDIDDVTDENNIHTALERIIELSTLNDRLGLEEFAEKLASHPDEAHRDIYIVMCEAVLLEDTDPSAAFEYYAQLLNYTEQMSKPSVEFLLHRVSKVAITIKDYDNALHALDTLSSSFSPSYTPQYAEMLYLVGRKEESLNRYEQYIGQFPDDIDTIFRLADLQKKEGNSDLARGLYKHILSKDPSYTAAKKQLDALAISDGQKLANLFR